MAAHLLGLLGHHRADHVRALRRVRRPHFRCFRRSRRFRRGRFSRRFGGLRRLRRVRRIRRGRFVEVFNRVRCERHIRRLGGKIGLGHHLRKPANSATAASSTTAMMKSFFFGMDYASVAAFVPVQLHFDLVGAVAPAGVQADIRDPARGRYAPSRRRNQDAPMSLVHAPAAAGKQTSFASSSSTFSASAFTWHGAARCDHHIIGDDRHFVNLEPQYLAALASSALAAASAIAFTIHVCFPPSKYEQKSACLRETRGGRCLCFSLSIQTSPGSYSASAAMVSGCRGFPCSRTWSRLISSAMCIASSKSVMQSFLSASSPG